MSSREAQPRDSSVFGKAGYRREAGNILRLAWPLMIAQGGYMLMGVVDTAVVGHVGSLDMAAVGLGNGLVGVILAVGIGISLGVEPLIGQAHGAKDPRRARAWLWQAGWLVALLSVPLVLLTIGAMWLLEPAGIDSTIAARTTERVTGS